MPMTTLVDARSAAERLRAAICNTPATHTLDGKPVSVSASIGLSMGGDTNASIEALLQISDRALYGAKAEGRNQVTLGSHAAA
jgi:two-component system cell cycle response regulator